MGMRRQDIVSPYKNLYAEKIIIESVYYMAIIVGIFWAIIELKVVSFGAKAQFILCIQQHIHIQEKRLHRGVIKIYIL